jgi:DNA replication protein DnaC
MSNLEELLERLRLAGFKKALHEELQQAQQTGCALSQSLLRLLTAEYAHRQQQSMLYRLSQAKIPFDWSLESFPFKKQPAVNKKQIFELADRSTNRLIHRLCRYDLLVFVTVALALSDTTCCAISGSL